MLRFFYFNNLKFDEAINPIPIIPMIVAMPEFISPKMFP